jgi:hypothetical protein
VTFEKTLPLGPILVLVATACSTVAAPPCTEDVVCTASPARYRLAGSGIHWDIVGDDRVVEDLLPRYPEFFEVVLDPNDSSEPDLRPLRDHLEQPQVDRRNFDALNAIAVAYFELNYRAESDRGGGRYFADSFRAAKLLAAPWRAYGGTRDPLLRDAILDFFEDAATGEKLRARDTAPRVGSIAESLEAKESEPNRRARIRRIVEQARGAQLHQ